MKSKLKIAGIVVIIVIVLLFLIPSGENKEVQDDLLNYINNELPVIAPVEEIVINDYGSVSGDNYTDDQTMYDMLYGSVIDNSSKLVDLSENIEIKTSEVREVHEVYIDAVNTQHSAMTTIMDALETQNYSKVSEANDKLSEARRKMREYLAELKELAEEYNVEFIE